MQFAAALLVGLISWSLATGAQDLRRASVRDLKLGEPIAAQPAAAAVERLERFQALLDRRRWAARGLFRIRRRVRIYRARQGSAAGSVALGRHHRGGLPRHRVRAVRRAGCAARHSRRDRSPPRAPQRPDRARAEEARRRISLRRRHGRALRHRRSARLHGVAGGGRRKRCRHLVYQAGVRTHRRCWRSQDRRARELFPQAGPERREPAAPDAIDPRAIRELGAARNPAIYIKPSVGRVGYWLLIVPSGIAVLRKTASSSLVSYMLARRRFVPASTARERSAPRNCAPSAFASVRSAPTSFASMSSAPISRASRSEAPSSRAPRKKAKSSAAAERSAPVRVDSARRALRRSTLRSTALLRSARVRRAIPISASLRSAPARLAPSRLAA